MINSAIDEGLDQLQQYSCHLVSGAMSTAAVLSNLATGIVVCLFSLFFLLSSGGAIWRWLVGDRKSTRLNSSHVAISYAVFCLKKKKFHATILHIIEI